ncbi:MAG: hypothetical protein HFK00_02705 [Oscillospiraceae bacterium]|nr:hypothetical protein [Oscillospiraceae bacterium]
MKAIENIKLSSSQKRKLSIFILMILLLAGAIAGTLMVCMGKDDVFSSPDSMFYEFIRNYSKKTTAELFLCSLKPMIIILLLQFISGFFAIGQPIAVGTIILKGVVSGISASAVYLNYGARGAAVNLVMLVPFVLISSFILIMGARESVRFSNHFFRFAVGKQNDTEVRPEIKLYCLRFAVLILFSLIISAADSVLTGLLDGLLIPKN